MCRQSQPTNFDGATSAQPWWLGYLETGVADLAAADAPRVAVYAGWPYVLLEGGPQQALAARRNSDVTPWHSAVPELVFPRDRSWLVSTKWDDDWRCGGGPAAWSTVCSCVQSSSPAP